MSNKLSAIIVSLAFLMWPANFGSMVSPAIGGEVPLVAGEDVSDQGPFQVFIITGASAKRLLAKYRTQVLVDFEKKWIFLLRIEA